MLAFHIKYIFLKCSSCDSFWPNGLLQGLGSCDSIHVAAGSKILQPTRHACGGGEGFNQRGPILQNPLTSSDLCFLCPRGREAILRLQIADFWIVLLESLTMSSSLKRVGRRNNTVAILESFF